MTTREQVGTGIRGVVYVIHFDRPYKVTRPDGRTVEVRHYIGWSSSKAMLRYRLAHHMAGRGSRLMAAVSKAGITWQVVAVFHDADRHFERLLHRRRDTPRWCPCCTETERRVRMLRRQLKVLNGKAVPA
jgi:hypothetical protein